MKQGLCGLVPLTRAGVLEDIKFAYSGLGVGRGLPYKGKQREKQVICQSNKFLLGLIVRLHGPRLRGEEMANSSCL